MNQNEVNPQPQEPRQTPAPKGRQKNQTPNPSPETQPNASSEMLELIREAGRLAAVDTQAKIAFLREQFPEDALVCTFDVRILFPGGIQKQLKGVFSIGNIDNAYQAADALPTLEAHLRSGILQPALSTLQSRFVEEDIPKAQSAERPEPVLLALRDAAVPPQDSESVPPEVKADEPT